MEKQTIIILILLGAIAIALILLTVVLNPLNISRLSMNPFTKKVREHGRGLSLKLPYCLFEGPPVDERVQLVITSGGILNMSWEEFQGNAAEIFSKISSMTYEVGDNVYFGKWAAAVWALPGSLRNLYQKTGPVAALTAMSKINTNISDYMFKLAKDADPDEILGMKTEISEHVAEMFGGEDVATDFEKSIGLNVGNPWLFDLNFGKRSMEAKEKLYEAEMFHKSLQQIEEDVKDPDKRANTMLAVNGMLQKNVIDLEGSTDALTGGLLSLFTKKK